MTIDLKVHPFVLTTNMVCLGLFSALEFQVGMQLYQGVGEVGEQRRMGEKEDRKKELGLDDS